ncbi:hypothetical protein LZ31DRAFT_370367 [Colletotrichum somersetense]|nr:hypothetical protein LZ31DRAFT_370367 [Colletotrichum somersetense]
MSFRLLSHVFPPTSIQVRVTRNTPSLTRPSGGEGSSSRDGLPFSRRSSARRSVSRTRICKTCSGAKRTSTSPPPSPSGTDEDHNLWPSSPDPGLPGRVLIRGLVVLVEVEDRSVDVLGVSKLTSHHVRCPSRQGDTHQPSGSSRLRGGGGGGSGCDAAGSTLHIVTSGRETSGRTNDALASGGPLESDGRGGGVAVHG